MGIFRKIGRGLGWLVDVRADRWIGYAHIKRSLSKTSESIRSLFRVEQAHRQESFQEAVERLQLNEQLLAQRSTEFFRLTLSFCGLSLILLGYMVYCLMQAAFVAALVSLLFAILMALQGFRFFFWRYQIQQRRLGCSFKEALYGLFR